VTVERGTDWGSPGKLPADAEVASSDAEVGAIVEEHRRAARPLPVVGLVGGDLCRTLGGTGDVSRLRSDVAIRLPVDVGAALVDGRLHWFVSHLVARRSWWRGRVVAVMNAQWLGRWDVAPGAHPGDGLLDVVDAELDLADRLKARRRLPTGTHVPHPGIRVRRVAAWQTELRPPLDVWLDGVPLGRTVQLSVRVEPGCLTVVV
jgi:diacylglycerol kinase family enzyme